jgi:hypothetical protein
MRRIHAKASAKATPFEDGAHFRKPGECPRVGRYSLPMPTNSVGQDLGSLRIFAALDQRLVAAVKGIKLLSAVSWPARVQQEFLARWHRGESRLPEVEYPRFEFSEVRAELDAIAAGCDPQHPLGDYLHRTIESYRIATRLLEALGTAGVTEQSIRLFGKPGDRLPGGELSNTDAARHFIGLADELDRELTQHESDYVLPAEILQVELQEQISRFFVHHKVRVDIDPDLIAKAAAGPHPHPPARRHRFHRVRPPPAARTRSFRAFAHCAERARTAEPALAGIELAAHHGHAGRPGHVRRTHYRRDRHRPDEAHQLAHSCG